MRIFVGTKNGVARVADDGGRFRAEVGLEGLDVQCLAVDPGNPERVYAGTWDHGLHRSEDGGATWEPAPAIAERRIISVAVSRADGGSSVAYAGAEPANLYRSDDGGATWRPLPGLLELPSARRWYYPPRRGGQRVRSIAPHPSDPDLLFVGIEVGGVMRSRDGGETWEDHRRGAFEDSHALALHPLAPDRVYQGAAGGIAVSNDRGESWRHVDKGVRRLFIWALAIDPVDPALWYVSAAHSPHHAHAGDGAANAAIYRKQGDDRWRIPSGSDRLARMPFALLTLAGRPRALMAGFDDGRVTLSEDAGESWTDLGVRLAPIRALAEA
jgi:photosystem II stability/assembly factor-like uncharacterized protein